MLLSQILAGVPLAEKLSGDAEISAVELDSRKTVPGALFIALNGKNSDGRKFIPDALEKGAAAVLYDGDYTPPAADGVLFVRADGDMRQNIARAAANFYKPVPPYISAVTGTNGKTSIANFTRQLMKKLGYSAASIGTVGVVSDVAENAETLTTPDSVTLHRILRDLAVRGVDYVSLEASSIGIEQYRLDGLKIKAAGFTNFTQDHLDYHLTMENYLKAKEELFSRVMETDGTAVLNADIPEFAELAEICRRRGIKVMSYGRNGSDLKILSRVPHAEGQTLETEIEGRPYRLELPLIGEFQAMNVLCAVGMVIAMHGFSGKIIDSLPHLKGAPGRLDLAGRLANGAAVYVDYAHTPDALDNVIRTVNQLRTGNETFTVVAGCGGDRDRTKRPEMAAIVAEGADRAIFTSDNPRSEDPMDILEEMMAGVPAERTARVLVNPDRRQAIRTAVAMARKGDIILVAGKGHETYQEVKGVRTHFDDMEQLREAFSASAAEKR